MVMDKKIRIGFDVNETLDNLIELLLKYYNIKYEDDIKFEDITDYNICKFLKPQCKDVFNEFINDEFMSNLTLRPGAKDFVNRCNEKFTVRMVTASFPQHFNLFYEFLMNNFDWFKSINFTRIQDKQEYNVDVLFDDYENNLIGGSYHKFLIKRPWNLHVIKRGIIKIDEFNDDVFNLMEKTLGIKLCSKTNTDANCFNCKYCEDDHGYPNCNY